MRRLRVLGRHVNAYIDDEMYVDEVDKWALHYTRHTGVELHEVDDLEAEVLRRPPTKLVAITDADDVTRILPDLQRRWRDRLFVERSQPEYIEFAAGGVSKSGALQWLCERLGLSRERAVACGDGDNDRDMLRWAGLGVAMAEAAPEVRAAAGMVVPRAELPDFFVRLAAARRAGDADPAPDRPKAAPGGWAPPSWGLGVRWDGRRSFPPDGTRTQRLDCECALKGYGGSCAASSTSFAAGAAQAEALLDLGVAVGEGTLVRLLFAEELFEHRAGLAVGAVVEAPAVLRLGGALVGDRLLEDGEQTLVADLAPIRRLREERVREPVVRHRHVSLVILSEKLSGKSSWCPLTRRRPSSHFSRNGNDRPCVNGNSCRKSRRSPRRRSGSIVSAKPWTHS